MVWIMKGDFIFLKPYYVDFKQFLESFLSRKNANLTYLFKAFVIGIG